MIDGYYTNPKHNQVKPKVACVIPVYVCKKDYGHYREDKLETITMNLAAHKHYKAGIDYDIILVNHGKPINFPEYKILERPNFGYSFGAYKQAWETYKKEYDFYLFNEDDIAPSKDGWLAEILLKFMSDKNIGAVGNFVEGRSADESGSDKAWSLINFNRDMMYNFDGAFTFTSSRILEQVEEIGGLPVFPCMPETKLPATVNEMVFQQPILELGYKILSFADGEHFVVHGSEVFTGDVMHNTGPLCPLINLNGRRKIEAIRKNYEWYQN